MKYLRDDEEFYRNQMSKNTQKKRNLKLRKCKKLKKSKINEEENSLTVRRSDTLSSIRIKSAKYKNR